jgi:hypothetical protein
VTNDFDKNGYVHLKGFLDLDNCKELTQELNKYIERGETTKDPQCPYQKLYMVQLHLIHYYKIYYLILNKLVVKDYILLTLMLGYINLVKN